MGPKQELFLIIVLGAVVLAGLVIVAILTIRGYTPDSVLVSTVSVAVGGLVGRLTSRGAPSDVQTRVDRSAILPEPPDLPEAPTREDP